MLDAPSARTDHELRLLAGMVDCAEALGMAFGQAAQAEADMARKIELFDAFNRSFQAVRLGIRLRMVLRAAPGPAPAAEQDPAETERMERDSGDRGDREREDDRDRETASVPKFLATLRGVAADAARLDHRLPADARAGATTLKDLLARAAADATPPRPARAGAGVDLLVRPPQIAAPAARAALLGSASAPLVLRPRPPPRRSG